eukprot:5537236-Pyramimonas_sp.AAC.1
MRIPTCDTGDLTTPASGLTVPHAASSSEPNGDLHKSLRDRLTASSRPAGGAPTCWCGGACRV